MKARIYYTVNNHMDIDNGLDDTVKDLLHTNDFVLIFVVKLTESRYLLKIITTSTVFKTQKRIKILILLQFCNVYTLFHLISCGFNR